MLRILILLSIFISTSLFAESHKKSQHPIKNNTTIGKSLNANQYDNIYFSGQPSAEDFRQLKKQGFVHIINLRGSSEGLYREKIEIKQVKEAKLQYSHIPFSMSEKLNDDFISKVTASVKKHRKRGKTLIHCGSGTRVAVWLGGHFHKDHKLSKTESIDLAKKLGLPDGKAEKMLRDYLAQKK